MNDLLAKEAIRSDLIPEEAAAIFWILTDPALYHQLVIQARLGARPVPAWLYEAFQTQILVPRRGG